MRHHGPPALNNHYNIAGWNVTSESLEHEDEEDEEEELSESVEPSSDACVIQEYKLGESKPPRLPVSA